MAKLYFYYSAMNAGKSTMLIQANYNYKEKGLKTKVYLAIPNQTNQTNSVIESRIGLDLEAIGINTSFNIYDDIVKELKTNYIDAIFVDEAQFLSKVHVLQLCNIVDGLNIPVLCYGLKTSFTGSLFEGSMHLIAFADKLYEVKSICFCGSKATMNYRITDNTDTVLLDKESYTTYCRKHYFENMKNLD